MLAAACLLFERKQTVGIAVGAQEDILGHSDGRSLTYLEPDQSDETPMRASAKDVAELNKVAAKNNNIQNQQVCYSRLHPVFL